MNEESWAVAGTYPDPFGYAATASGPAVDDLIGPPGSILDIYYDGTPVEAGVSQAAQSNGTKRGGVVGFLMRGDVHALAIAVVGGWMIKRFIED